MKKDFHAMADRILIDTNILLYAYDRGEPVKQPEALAVMDRLVTWRIGVLTPQVLAEFFVNATRKLDPPLTVEDAYERIQNYLMSWKVIDVTGPVRGSAWPTHLQDVLLACSNLGFSEVASDSSNFQ